MSQEKINNILDDLKSLTLLEAVQLVSKILRIFIKAFKC